MHTPATTLSTIGRLTALSLLAACGCSVSAPSLSTSSPETAKRHFRVAAASDLVAALPEVVREYERDNPEVKVDLKFGSSGQLAEQIKAGAPFDLFLAANESFVKNLAEKHIIFRESVRPYAVGSLAMVVRTEVKDAVASLQDILKPEIKKVAVADPATAPYGNAAFQVLRNAGLLDQVEPKLVRAGAVSQAFQFVETGNADVAFVGRALTKGRNTPVVDIDPALYKPIVQGLGVVAASENGGDAEAFADYITGPIGQSILKSFGFGPPPAAQP